MKSMQVADQGFLLASSIFVLAFAVDGSYHSGCGDAEVCAVAEGILSNDVTAGSLVQVRSHNIKILEKVPRSTLNSKHSALSALNQEETVSVIYGNDRNNSCPDGHTRITDLGECRAAMPWLDGGQDDFMGSEDAGDFPGGCYICSERTCDDGSGVWFNKNTTGKTKRGARPICKKGFAVKTGQTIFVGDSDIDYWHSSVRAVPGSYNLGIGGATCADVKKEIDFLLKRFQPKNVVLVCGENDLAGNGKNVHKTFAHWTSVVGKISAAGVPIVQFGTKPEADSVKLWRSYQKYDSKIKAFVAAGGHDIVFVDTYKAFVELGNGNEYYDPDEAPDYLHLGPKGYALWDRWVQNSLSDSLGCVLWTGDKCEMFAPSVSVLEASTCPANSRPLKTKAECKAAVGLVKLNGNSFQDSEVDEDWPAGCYYCKDTPGCADGTWFNDVTAGTAKQGAKLYCKSEGPSVSVVEATTNGCPANSRPLKTEAECKAAVGLVKLSGNSFQDSEVDENWPAGCYYCKNIQGCEDGTWFNDVTAGTAKPGAKLYCKSER